MNFDNFSIRLSRLPGVFLLNDFANSIKLSKRPRVNKKLVMKDGMVYRNEKC